MSYPDYPKNRLIVNGVDLTERFKMVLADGYTLSPPEPKTYTVDIPGGNGALDLTESLIGDTVYKNRKAEFTFHVIYIEQFEKIKTEVSNFLHGRAYDFQMTMDPGYTYHGRFKVTGYSHKNYVNGIVGTILVSVEAEPFKYMEDQVFSVSAVGGKIIYLPSGRKTVRPTIETDTFTKVIYDHKLLKIPQGSWVINDLLLKEGDNELYFSTYDIKNMIWEDFETQNITWGMFKQKPLYEWYKLHGDETYIKYSWFDLEGKTWDDIGLFRWSELRHDIEYYSYTWKDVENKTWRDFKDTKWVDLRYANDITKDIKDVYIKYEWGDL